MPTEVIIDNDGAGINSTIIAFSNDFEQPKFSYNGDLFAGFAFRKRWSVELGVGFSNRGYKTEELNITTVDNPS